MDQKSKELFLDVLSFLNGQHDELVTNYSHLGSAATIEERREGVSNEDLEDSSILDIERLMDRIRIEIGEPPVFVNLRGHERS